MYRPHPGGKIHSFAFPLSITPPKLLSCLVLISRREAKLEPLVRKESSKHAHTHLHTRTHAHHVIVDVYTGKSLG